jgi:hypothetical protein
MKGKGEHTSLAKEGLLACIEKEHLAERNLCDMLERIADSLLEPIDTELARTSIVTLRGSAYGTKQTFQHM